MKVSLSNLNVVEKNSVGTIYIVGNIYWVLFIYRKKFDSYCLCRGENLVVTANIVGKFHWVLFI